MTRRTPRFCPFVQILESRITPDAFQVNDSGDQPWDSSKYPNDGKTTGGMYTLRSVLGYAEGKNKSAEVTFSGPMTISVGSLLPLPAFGQPLTVTGPTVAAYEAPKVSIVGSGQAQGFFVRTGSAIRNVRVAGFQFNLDFESGASGVTVERCFIGTDEGGTGRGPDDKFGIFVYNNLSNSDIRDNVVSGNSHGGIYVGSSTNVRIERNRVGTDATGKLDVGNGYAISTGFGIALTGGSGNKIIGNTVGGQAGSGSFGRGEGITLDFVSDTVVDDNKVGVGVDGSTPIPNGVGISVAGGTRVEVGTTKGNVVAGNAKNGVTVNEGTECKVVGNFVGVTRDGTPRPNGANGIEVSGTKHVIGGSEAGKGNVIAANKGSGVYVFGDEITIQGNYIGTNAAGGELGNGRYGVQIIGSKNVIGADPTGTDPAAGNTIAFNGADLGLRGHGVVVGGTNRTQNAIRLNKVFMNKGRGIDLGGDAWYRNDPRDADHGNNNQLNHPTIIGVIGDTVRWMLNAPSNTKFTIDVYRDPDNGFTEYAEGKDHLQTLTVETDVTGHVEFETHDGSDRVTATATDSTGNTSTFSLADADADGLADTWETATGLDLNDDGTAEYVPPGANRLRKDVYVEYASMTGWAPLPEALGRVIVAFAGSPVLNPAGGPGVTLHLEAGYQTVLPAEFAGPDSWAPFHAIKQGHFANNSGSGSDLYKAKLLVSRFAVFGIHHSRRGSSGTSELIGNDFMVTLGGWFGSVPDGKGSMRPRTAAEAADLSPTQRVRVAADQAGTFLHELGHTLGLGHSGPYDWDGTVRIPVTEFDPLFRSSLNYIYQAPGGKRYSGTQILDYSAASPNEWDNLWFAFQESERAASGSDLSAVVDDEPNELPTFAATECDLTAVVFPPPTGLTVGAPTAVVFTVLNSGPATAADSTFTLTVPDGLDIGTVTPGRGTATVSGRTIVVRLGGIDGFDGATVTVQLTPTREAVFTLTSHLSTTTPDGLPGNDSSAVVLQVGDVVPVPPPPPPPSRPPSGDFARYAVAAGPGGGPHVVVFDGTTPVGSFFAYDPRFTGGVHVTTGDVTGDGVPDVITGAGAGGGPHVKVFDGTTYQMVREFFAFDAGFRGGVSVAVGDVTGDGAADVVVAAGAGGAPHVKVFDGATGAEVRSFFAYAPEFVGGVHIAVGDLNGDGFADVITGAGAGGAPHVLGFDGRTGAELMSFFAYDSGFTGGVCVAVGDVSGDGVADIVTGAGGGGGPLVRAFRGFDFSLLSESLAFDPAFQGGVLVG